MTFLMIVLNLHLCIFNAGGWAGYPGLQEVTMQLYPTEMLADGLITLERDDAVLVITLNRPEKLNALTSTMLAALGEVFTAAQEDASVRVVVLTGAGRAFCAGADAGGLKKSAERSLDERLAYKPTFTPRHCGLFKPTICAVNGICAGAGLHFVGDCDIIIAGESASFTDTHVNIGQVTALEPIGLARRIPLGAVLRMVILGKSERLDAAAALSVHLVSEVLPDNQLRERAMALAQIAAQVSPAAVQASLRAVWGSFEPALSDAYTAGLEAVMRHRDHPDAVEGPLAFLEKRAPRWQP
ncbi:enoyl-CoA hydratase/isomerase family protein [Pseudomonas sp. NFX224]|uniref:enoyl-CoA hydratase/isomerase family protein n=1 Tax=Pseudomonas sp. NFX224 TaxID=3402862 RepID=UPI003AFA4633